MIPANHSFGGPQNGFLDYRAHAFYSDDHGKTFHVSANVEIPGSNESTAAETGDGKVLMNIRNQHGTPRQRIMAVSNNGGNSWDTTYNEHTLIDPVCQGSMIHIALKKNSVLLFSNLTGKDCTFDRVAVVAVTEPIPRR